MRYYNYVSLSETKLTLPLKRLDKICRIWAYDIRSQLLVNITLLKNNGHGAQTSYWHQVSAQIRDKLNCCTPVQCPTRSNTMPECPRALQPCIDKPVDRSPAVINISTVTRHCPKVALDKVRNRLTEECI